MTHFLDIGQPEDRPPVDEEWEEHREHRRLERLERLYERGLPHRPIVDRDPGDECFACEPCECGGQCERCAA